MTLIRVLRARLGSRDRIKVKSKEYGQILQDKLQAGGYLMWFACSIIFNVNKTGA